MKPKVDQSLCIGCGACQSNCPEVFKLGDDNKSHVIEGVDYEKCEDCIKMAISICPVQAISLEE